MSKSELSEKQLTEQFIKIISTKDPFWAQAEKNLMAALAHYVYSEMPEDQRTLQSAYNLLTVDGLAKLDAFFAALDGSHPAKAAYENFKNTNTSIKRAIVSSISAQINCQV